MSAEQRSTSKSRSHERKKGSAAASAAKKRRKERGGKEAMQLDESEDGQGLGWAADAGPAGLAGAATQAAPVPTGDDTLPAIDSSDESDPELLPDLDGREDLKDAPPYFLAAMRIQAAQTRGDVKHHVTKSLKKTNKQLTCLAAGVHANHIAIQSNQSAIIDLKEANDKLEKEVGDLNSALDIVKKRLDELEKAERSYASTAPSSNASSGGCPPAAAFPQAPLGAHCFAGYQRQADSTEIDRARFCGGSHPDMPKAAVQSQLEKAVQDYNQHADYGMQSGHLVVDAPFIPMTVSIGGSSSDHRLEKVR